MRATEPRTLLGYGALPCPPAREGWLFGLPDAQSSRGQLPPEGGLAGTAESVHQSVAGDGAGLPGPGSHGAVQGPLVDGSYYKVILVYAILIEIF